MATLPEAQQLFAPGELVVLYELDLTNLGGGISYLTSTVAADADIAVDGQIYAPAAIEAEGFEASSRKEGGRPTIRIVRTPALMSLVATYHDGVGGILRRMKTYSRFLDGGADADPTALFDLQVWRIARKGPVHKVHVEWELASPLDQPAAKIPLIQMLRSHCGAMYRRYLPDHPDADVNGYVNDTTRRACPYEGAAAFDALDQPTTAANDRASKTLGCCRARFGQNAVLPFMAEPSLGDVR